MDLEDDVESVMCDDPYDCEIHDPPYVEEPLADPGPADEEEVGHLTQLVAREDMEVYRKVADLRSDGPWLLRGTPTWVYDEIVVLEYDGIDEGVVYWREPDGFLTLIERHLQGHADYCDPEHISHIALLEPHDLERVRADRAEMSIYLGYDLNHDVSKGP